ncbi:hypothetical protein WME90_38750 [Sorangium sp. So ce375]|uniref:hypothetical protein n=1 Tax=Sorangium sp. So ce375 TaxID=3133306 RepID=UPI003F5C4E9E
MRTFLRRILVASQWGASLAVVCGSGCGTHVESGASATSSEGGTSESSSSSSSPEGATSGVGSGSSSSGGATSAAGGGGEVDPPDASAPLDPYPDPTCVGPFHDGGYYGQCCYEVHCTAPVGGACPAASEAPPHIQDLPPGSGTCTCSADGEGGVGWIQGPYANRTASDPASCCYLVGSIACEGRPLLVRGEPRVAPLARGQSAWSETAWERFQGALADADRSALSPAERRELARRWAERGRNEHASVASFGRFALALMAQGAPPQLLEAAHRAAIDEVRHARLALAIASAYAGEPVGVGPLPLHGALDDIASLEALTLATVVEGCVGETLSAIEAEVAAQAAQPPAVRMALQAIARDEARHAELAWAFIRWAVTTGGAGLRERVAAVFARALDQVGSEAAGTADRDLPPSHGFLAADELHRLRQQALADVLRPAAAALVAEGGSSAEREFNGARGNAVLRAGATSLST